MKVEQLFWHVAFLTLLTLLVHVLWLTFLPLLHFSLLLWLVCFKYVAYLYFQLPVDYSWINVYIMGWLYYFDHCGTTIMSMCLCIYIYIVWYKRFRHNYSWIDFVDFILHIGMYKNMLWRILFFYGDKEMYFCFQMNIQWQ